MGSNSKEPWERVPLLRTFALIRRTIREEFDDPWGRVNAGFGVILALVLVGAVLKYFAASVSMEIDTPFFKAELSGSSTFDGVVALVIMGMFILYWGVCMRAFVELDPFRARREREDD